MVDVITKDVDFAVREKPVRVSVGGKYASADGYRAMVRQDTGEILAINGSRYKTVDHRKNLILVAKALGKITTDFTVKHVVENARIFSRFTIESDEILPGVGGEASRIAIESYNSYDGSRSWEIGFSVWRKICSNGMYGFARELSLRKQHTRALKTETLVKNLGQALVAYKKAYVEFYEALKGKKMIPDENLEKTFTAKLIKSARDSFQREIRITKEEDAWTQYNSFTRSITHDPKISEQYRQELHKQLASLFLGFYNIAK